MTDHSTTPGEALVASTAVLTLGAGIVAFVHATPGTAALVLALGWLVVVPLLAILTDAVGPVDLGGAGPTADEAAETDDALDALRERYARGDVDEAEFERRVERLLETEDGDRPDRTVADGRERER